MESSIHLIAKDNRLYLALAISLLLFVLIGTRASGTAEWPGFGREVRYDSGGQIGADVVTADFNGDGVPDVAVINDGDGQHSQVSLLLGKSDGTLQALTNYPIERFPRKIAVGDFNGDGKSDLVIAISSEQSSATYGLDVLLGNGDGTLQASVFYSLAGRPQDIAVADFNHDNYSDVAVKNDDSLYTSNINESGVSVLLSGKDGTLSPETQYPFSGHLIGIAVGDFNNDGELDIATENVYTSEINVLSGVGDGTFGERKISAGPVNAFRTIAAADFNRDGKLDLAIIYYGNSEEMRGIRILLGNGDGSFVLGASYSSLNLFAYPDGQGITSADFNGDGLIDLALTVSSAGYNNVDVLLGNGDGTFQTALIFPAARSAESLAVADFNLDGKPDLVLGNDSARSFISVMLNSVFVPEPCRKPGPTTLVIDATGDARDGNPSHDIESVSVSETFSANGEQLLIFTLKMADLHTIAPDNYWNVGFNSRFGNSGGMRMSSRGGQISFIGNKASGSYDPDGTITFVVARREFDLLPGDQITGIQAYVNYQIAEGYELFDSAPDVYPSTVTYTLGGNDACATPTPSPSASPTATSTPTPTPSPGPQLFTEEGSGLALAFDSVTLMREPFPLTEAYNFSSDGRTRIVIFASGVELLPGETASAVTAQGEDVQQTTYSLPVEYVGKVPGFDWLAQIVVKLPAEINGNDKLWVSINFHGGDSNKRAG